MLNKKILAAAIAASLSTSAFAAVDLNAGTGTVKVAAESIDQTDLNADGMVELSGAGLAVNVKAGFSIADSTSKYVRFDLTNAKFSAITSLDDDGTDGTDNTTVTVPSAGGVNSTFVIFELAADVGDITSTEVLTFTATYRATNNSSAGITYKLFETAQDAIDNDTNGLASANGTVASISSALTGTFSTAATAEAKVASEFKNFDGAALPGTTTATLATFDAADLVGAGTWAFPDGTAFDATDLATGSATITLSGDFSFGTFDVGANDWSYDEDGDVQTNGTVTANTSGTFTVPYSAATFDVNTIDTDAVQDAAKKGSYTATLSGVTVTGVTNAVNAVGSYEEAAGTISYDTTTIEVPYVSTYSEYNQRIYIINSGGQDAAYTTTFTTENGIDADAGTKATGTVPAGKMLMIKATDLVSFTGGTRGAATIEIEAQNTNVQATSQTVNLDDGSTDTVVLYSELNTKN